MVDSVRRRSLRDPVAEAQRNAERLQQEQFETEGEFKKGLRSGMHGLEASYYGLKSAGNALIGDDQAAVDNALEAKRLSDNAAKLGPEVSDLSQIESAEDVGSYALGVLGQALPSIATTVAGGGVGGILAKTAAKKLAERQVKKAVGDLVKKQVATATTRGAQAGAYVTSAGMEAGSAQQNILDPANRAAWESVQRGKRVKDAQNGQHGHIINYLDGDSFVFQPEDGSEPYQIRLPHINTADEGQEGKAAARQRLMDLTGGRELSVLPSDQIDQFGRRVAPVYAPGQDLSLSEQMLESGAATVHPRYEGQENLYKLERQGRQADGSLPNYTSRHAQYPLTPGQVAARDERGNIPDPATSALGRPLSLREQTLANIIGPGLIGGALEALLPTRILGKYGLTDKAVKFIKADTGVKKALAVAKNVGKEAVKGMPVEGVTEGVQQAIQRATNNFVDQNKDILGEEGMAEILNATAAGAIGGLWGGVGGANVRFENKDVADATADLDARIEEIQAAAPPDQQAADTGITADEVTAQDLTPEERAAFGFDQAFDPLDPGFDQIERDLGLRTQNYQLEEPALDTRDFADEAPDQVEVAGAPVDFNESQSLREISPYDRRFLDNVTLTPEANVAIGGKPVPAGQEPGIVTKARKLGKSHKVTSLRERVEAEAQKQFPGDPQAQTEFVSNYARQLFDKKDGGSLVATLEANSQRADQVAGQLAQAEQVLGPESDHAKQLRESLSAYERGIKDVAARMDKARDYTTLYDPAQPAAFLDHFQTIEAPEQQRSEAEFDLSDNQLKRIMRSVTRDYKPSGSSVRIGDKAVNLQRLVATVSKQTENTTQDRGLTRNLGDQLLLGLTLLAEKGVVKLPETQFELTPPVKVGDSTNAKRQAARELLKQIPQDTVIYRSGKSQVTVGQALRAKAQEQQAAPEVGSDQPQVTGRETGEVQPVPMEPVKRDERGVFVGRDERFEQRKDKGETFDFEPTPVTREEVARFRSAGKAAAAQIKKAKSLIDSNPRQAMLEARNALMRFGVKDETIRKQIVERPKGMTPAQRAVGFAEYVLDKQRKELAAQQKELKERGLLASDVVPAGDASRTAVAATRDAGLRPQVNKLGVVSGNELGATAKDVADATPNRKFSVPKPPATQRKAQTAAELKAEQEPKKPVRSGRVTTETRLRNVEPGRDFAGETRPSAELKASREAKAQAIKTAEAEERKAAAARAKAASDAAYERVGLKPPGERQAEVAKTIVAERKEVFQTPQPKVEKPKGVSDKLIAAVSDVTLNENYARLDTPQKVLAYAENAERVMRHLEAQKSLTEDQQFLLNDLRGKFMPGSIFAFDWNSLLDGLNPTDAQVAKLESITRPVGFFSNKQFGPGVAPMSTKQLIENGDPAFLKKENAVLKAWAGALGIKQDMRMVSIEDIEQMYELAPDPAKLRRGVESGAQYGFALHKGKTTYIFVHPNQKNHQLRGEILAHELGHVVMDEHYRGASKKTKDAIHKAYKKWRKENEGKTVAEIRLSVKADATAIAMTQNGKGQRDLSKLTPEQQQYILDFDEWFADQTARWLTTDKKPRGLVETFFHQLAATLLHFGAFISGSRKRFEADTSVAEYLDSLYTDVSKDPVLGLLEYLPTPIDGAMADLLMHPGVGIHDAAVRASLYEFLSKDELKAADKVFSGRIVRNRVRELLQRDGRDAAAKELMRNPEAAIAYAYDYWKRGELKLGPKGGSLMSSLSDAAEKHIGTVRADKRAEAVLESFRSGMVLAKAKGEGDFVIPPAQYQNNKLQRAVAAAKDLSEPAVNLLSTGTFSAVGQMRRTGNGWLRRIADVFAPQVGSTGEREGFHEARRRQQGKFSDRVQKIFEGYEDDPQFGRDFAAAMNTGELSEDPEIAAAQEKVWELLADMRENYFAPAGVKLGVQGRQEDGTVRYWPTVYDREYLAEHFDEFVTLIEKYASDELLTGRPVFDPKTGKKELRPTDNLNELTATERKAAAQRIARAIFEAKGSGDGDLTANKTSHRPFMSSFDMRMLAEVQRAAPEEYAKFLDANPGNTLHTYIEQGVKRAEFARRFGADGERLDTWLSRARKAGATENQIKLAHKFIAAQMGTLGADKITPRVRQGMGAMMVFQNVRTLSMALFSSLVDPLGILVRSGDVMTSLRAFKEGLRALVANSMGKRTEMEDLTEALGAIESHVINDALNWEYGGVFLGGRAARINNALFKYTGLSDWTRSTRIMATYAAMEFIKKHATKPNKNSKRFLDELGLTADYVKEMTKDGELDITDDKIQVALNRWVDDAILRPNASQRPIWGSDPRFMLVFHLKQFTYSFYDRILRRAWTEFADHRNIAPAMALLSYIPGMIMADLVRDALKDAGGDWDDDRKDDWDLSDYTWQATQRAGLLGVGQFAFDAQEAAEMGKPFFLPFAGPTADWAHSIYGAAKTGNWGDWASKQYPGQNLMTPLWESF